MAAIVEQNHSDKGILWPKNIAPIQVAIVPINAKNEEQMEAAERLYKQFTEAGFDVLLDDRNERAGIKFNDMDLIGAYTRITVGRDIQNGQVELKVSGMDEVALLTIDEVLAKVEAIFAN